MYWWAGRGSLAALSTLAILGFYLRRRATPRLVIDYSALKELLGLLKDITLLKDSPILNTALDKQLCPRVASWLSSCESKSNDTVQADALVRDIVRDEREFQDLLDLLREVVKVEGCCPLHLALEQRLCPTVVRWLLDAGADPNLPTAGAGSVHDPSAGKLPIVLALTGPYDALSKLKIAEALIAAGANVSHEAAHQPLNLLDQFASSFSANASSMKQCRSALHALQRNHALCLLRLLVSAGAGTSSLESLLEPHLQLLQRAQYADPKCYTALFAIDVLLSIPNASKLAPSIRTAITSCGSNLPNYVASLELATLCAATLDATPYHDHYLYCVHKYHKIFQEFLDYYGRLTSHSARSQLDMKATNLTLLILRLLPEPDFSVADALIARFPSFARADANHLMDPFLHVLQRIVSEGAVPLDGYFELLLRKPARRLSRCKLYYLERLFAMIPKGPVVPSVWQHAVLTKGEAMEKAVRAVRDMRGPAGAAVLMVTVDKPTEWSPQAHHTYPAKFRGAMRALLLSLHVLGKRQYNVDALNADVLTNIAHYSTTTMSCWF